MQDDISTVILGLFILVLIVVASSAFAGLIFMLLWNYALPVVWSGAPNLSFFQSWALWFLISMVVSVVRR